MKLFNAYKASLKNSVNSKLMELSKRNMKIIKLIGLSLFLFIIFSYYKLENTTNGLRLSKGIHEFYKTGIVYNPDVDNYIEADYFLKGKLENGDFSAGLSHWATVKSENKFSLNYDDYTSAPCSLKIEITEFPGRIYYSKNEAFTSIDSVTWGHQNQCIWLGVKPNMLVRASFYFKGAGPTTYINLLEKSGGGRVLVTHAVRDNSLIWKKVEISGLIPKNGRAITLEIAINKNQPGKIIFLDDLKLEILDNIAKKDG